MSSFVCTFRAGVTFTFLLIVAVIVATRVFYPQLFIVFSSQHLWLLFHHLCRKICSCLVSFFIQVTFSSHRNEIFKSLSLKLTWTNKSRNVTRQKFSGSGEQVRELTRIWQFHLEQTIDDMAKFSNSMVSHLGRLLLWDCDFKLLNSFVSPKKIVSRR